MNNSTMDLYHQSLNAACYLSNVLNDIHLKDHIEVLERMNEGNKNLRID